MENRRKKKYLILVSVLVILGLIGISYAVWLAINPQKKQNLISSKCFTLRVDDGEELTVSNAFPVSDQVGQATTPYHFTITNTCTSTFDYQINLESLYGTTLLPDYVRISLNNGEPFTLGEKESVNTTIATSVDSRKLLVGSLGAGNTVSYDLRMWLDYNSTIEQSAEKEFFTKVVVVSSMGSQNIQYKDSVIAEAPDVYQGLIPIRYEDTTMKIADTESPIGWYDYSTHEWANAALIKYSDNTIKNKYLNANMTPKVGVTIDIEDVLQMYVWIPRYKYKLWNVGVGTSTEQAIDIEFVSKDTKNPSGKTESEYRNGEWLVHPAFTFGDTELPGIWVGKFEMSGTLGAPTIIPNQRSLTSINVSNMFNTLHNMVTTNYNIYGINKDEIDTHMMKNVEWGSVAYLTNSIYGRYNADKTCIASGCEVWINNINTGYGNLEGAQVNGQPQHGPSITGCAGASVSAGWNNNKTACESGYDWLNNGVNASTTGNITGIYDMSGGTWEYVMGVMNESNNTTPRYFSSGFNASNMPDSKYYDTYAYQASDGTTGTTAADSLARYHLGEGTRETLRTIAVNTSAGWYSDYNYVVNSSSPWVVRGGYYNGGSAAGLFYFDYATGGASTYVSFRSVLSGK